VSRSSAPACAGPPALTVREIAALTGGVVARGGGGVAVRGVTADSRAVAPGMLFVALRGRHVDGHRFAEQACRLGAAAVLGTEDVPDVPPGAAVVVVPDALRALHRVARTVRDRLAGLTVVGITGSVGKTSTKELIAALAARRFRTLRSPRNWNTEIGIPLVLANAPADAEVAVVELAMRGPGQIRELTDVARPQIGVVTNVGESHLDFFPSRDALAEEKAALVDALPPDGVAVLNADDPLVMAMRRRTSARVVTFGWDAADVAASAWRALPGEGSAFRLHTPAGDADVALRLPGRHAVGNALAAAAAGIALGVPVPDIAAGLEGAAMLPMRLAVRRIGEITVVDDTYNSSPQSLAAALDVTEELPGAPRIAVLGDMRELGAISEDAHRRAGRWVAGRRFDLLIIFGPLAAAMAAAAREAGAGRVVHAVDPDEVVRELRRAVQPGALILVKGSRALEMERIVARLEDEHAADPAARSGRTAWA
jgi:UDP-N-acetylmuramoyl-tripeptide--D-alanyl-D-alanine ligase